METEFDVIVCGAGAAGSTTAGILAQDKDLRVLLLEAGPGDEDQRVSDPDRWPENLGTERDWGFVTEPGANVHNRRLRYSMGKGLGGGSSINAGVWSRSHRQDWENFAEACDDPRWNYESILGVYRELETWRGAPDPARRGTAGPMRIQPAQPLHPFFSAMLDGAESLGLDRYGSPNGELAERGGGCAVRDEIIDDGARRSPFRAFVAPGARQDNLTVLTRALVTRVMFEGHRAVGVEARWGDRTICFRAAREVVLSLGAVQTPKILMQSGIGPAGHLESFDIDVVANLPGVGTNLDDHLMFGCVWETSAPEMPPPPRAQAVCFWGADGHPDSPKFVMYSGAAAFMSPEDPTSVPAIETGYFDDPADLRDAVEAYRFAEAITEDEAMRPYRGASVLPGKGSDEEIAAYIRTAANTFWHQCGTARAGVDNGAVVDAELQVHGVENLRVADASVLPRVTSGNTMAPSVVIGYRAAQLIRR